mmetsp:Transcript_24940/g.35681  ORF Transcript_24940/g.35681 Transcript_24940/m.35681 type:complete len:344 (-) Transcript_24940:316-1347(-)
MIDLPTKIYIRTQLPRTLIAINHTPNDIILLLFHQLSYSPFLLHVCILLIVLFCRPFATIPLITAPITSIHWTPHFSHSSIQVLFHLRKRLLYKLIMMQNHRQPRMLLQTLPLTLRLQRNQLLHKRIHMFLNRRNSLIAVSLVNSCLGRLITVHVSIVELLFDISRLGTVLDIGQYFGIENDIHDFLADISSIMVKEHFGKVHPHIHIFGSFWDIHHLTERGRRRIIHKSIPSKQKGRVGRTSITNPQWRIGRHIHSSIRHGIPPLIKVHFHLGISPMVEHICHGCQCHIRPLPLLIGIGTSVHCIEAPFQQWQILLIIRTNQIDLLQDLLKILQLDPLHPRQ